MNKRGIIRASIFGLILILLLLIVILVLNSLNIRAEIVKDKYVVGETVKINLENIKNFKIKILTPSKTIVKVGSKETFVFKANEIGKYKFVLTYGDNQEEYKFDVIEKENKTELRNQPVDVNKTAYYRNNYDRKKMEFKIDQNSIAGSELKLVKKNGNDKVEIRKQIPSTWKIKDSKKIKLILDENNQEINFSGSDLNNDSIIDEINWTVTNLTGEQTYSIIIITNAEHLDTNRTFISDIYDSVKEQDGIWSENIDAGEYVRVTFEIPLDNTRDITIWPRVISGTPRVEVYEIGGSELVASFDNLRENEYNKVYLTNLIGMLDTFDLRVVGGTIQFDHIIDPLTSNFIDGAATGTISTNVAAPTTLTALSTAFPAGNNLVFASVQVLSTDGGAENIPAGGLILLRNDGTALSSNQYAIQVSTANLNNNYFLIGLDSGAGANVGYNVTGYSSATAVNTEAKITAISGLSYVNFSDSGSVAFSAATETEITTLPTEFSAGGNVIIASVQIDNGAAIQQITADSIKIKNGSGATLSSNEFEINFSSAAPTDKQSIVILAYEENAPANAVYNVSIIGPQAGDAEVKLAVFRPRGAQFLDGASVNLGNAVLTSIGNITNNFANNSELLVIATGQIDDTDAGVETLAADTGFTLQEIQNTVSANDLIMSAFAASPTVGSGIRHTLMWRNSTSIQGTIYNLTATASALQLRAEAKILILQLSDKIAPSVTSIVEYPTDPVNYTFAGVYNFSSIITDDELGTVIFTLNGVNYTTSNVSSTYNKSFIGLGAGTYNYSWYANDSAGNINNSENGTYTINKAMPMGNLTNTTSWTITFPTSVTVGLAEGNLGDGDVTYVVYRNNVSVGTGETIVLGGGTYVYLLNTTGGANYTANVSMDQEVLTVNRANSVLNLTLGGIAGNVTVEVGSTVNLTGYKLTGDPSGLISLYVEGNSINQGAGNISNLSTFNFVGIYNITVIYSESQNYSQSSLTYYILVNDTTKPLWRNQNQSGNAVGQGEINNLWVNWTDNYALANVWLETNESGSWQNYTPRKAGLTINDFSGTSEIFIDPVSASATISSVDEGFVRQGINLSYNYDSAFGTDTFHVVVNTSAINISAYQNISYYIKVDIAGFHETNLIVISSGAACDVTTPQTISGTGFTLITINIADITGGCDLNNIDQFRIRIGDDSDASTGTGNITLDELYLTSDLLRESIINFSWRNSSLSGGSVSWRIYMNDTLGNLNRTDIMTFNIQDLVFPQWSNNLSTPESPQTYNSTRNYQFNTTWTDNVNIQTVRIQHNFTGTMQNYSMSGSDGNVYYYDFTGIPTGTYTWQIIANDTSGNVNQTGFYIYTVNKASSEVNLTLDGIDGNVTVQVGNNNVNLTAFRLNGEGNIKLYNNGTLVNEGSPAIFNITNFTQLGDYNITVIYEQTQNYTSSFRTNYLFVRDNLFPNVTLNSPINGLNSSVNYLIFNATVREDYNLTNVSLMANFSGSFIINQTNTSGINGDYLFNVTNIADGGYIWAIIACDGSNNCNQTENRTLLIDSVNPLIGYGIGTDADGSNFTRNWVYVNVTVTELNEVNISYKLFNNTGLYNESIYTNGQRTINWTGLPNGIYTYNVSITDHTNKINSTTTRRITLDTIAPNWSGNVTSPANPATYTPEGFYQFNVSWTDNVIGIQTVFIEHNFTGIFANYSMSGNSGAVYFYNRTNLAAGGYAWRMYANDTLNNRNQTDLFTYTVSKSNPLLNLTLDEVDGNKTVEVHTIVNLTAYRLSGEGIISLYNDGVLINSGDGPLENLTSFNNTGSYNITIVYEGTQNYTQNSRTNYVIVQDTEFPTISQESPVNFYNISSRNVTFNVTANDNYNITNVSIWGNFSGPYIINQTNSSGTNGNYSFIITNIADGRYNWSAQVCDSSNNCNITLNRTITIDATPPVISAGAINATNISLNGYVRINCTVTDALIGLDTVLIGAEKPTLPQENYSTGILAGNTRYSDILLNEVGNWTFSCFANDTLNNLAGYHIGNVSVIQAADAPSVPVLQYPADGANLSSIPQFNWTNSTDPNGDLITYILEIDDDAGFGSPEYFNGSITETNNPTEDNSVVLPTDGQYNWRVRASDGGINSSFSPSRSFVIDRAPPAINLLYPANNSNVTSKEVNFTWNVSDNLNYPIYCNLTIDGTVNASDITSNNGFNTSSIVSELANGIHYWNITCRDLVNINTSATNQFTVYTVSNPAQINISLDSNNESLTIRWNNVSTTTSYNIYISTNFSAGFSSIPNVTGITDLNYTDNNANQSLLRFYKVSAVYGPAENLSQIIVGKIQPAQLSAGFNMISWPLNLTNYILNNGTNNGYNIPTKPSNCLLSLFTYNGSKFLETNNDQGAWAPSIGDENFVGLEPLRSYWAEINTGCNITFIGEVPRFNLTTSLNNTFNMIGWNSAYHSRLGEEATLGNPLSVSPVDSFDNIFRYNSSKAVNNPQLSGFQGMHHFSGYGWWPFYGDDDFNKLIYSEGYYVEISVAQSNWTHNPNFNN